MKANFPTAEVQLGHLVVVQDVGRSRDFYRDVLQAKILREFEGSFCQLDFQGALIFLVAGGDPTPDKPDVTFVPPADPNKVSTELVLRVPDCQEAFDALSARGAKFFDRTDETRLGR